jgi:hypothetical protein
MGVTADCEWLQEADPVTSSNPVLVSTTHVTE